MCVRKTEPDVRSIRDKEHIKFLRKSLLKACFGIKIIFLLIVVILENKCFLKSEVEVVCVLDACREIKQQ